MFEGEVKEAIDRSVLCWLATVDAEGQPNVSPKEIFCAEGPDTLLIAEIASPVSRRNLAVNHRVCVSFVDVFRQKGYKVNGDARLILSDTPEFERRAGPLLAMAGTAFTLRGLIEVAAHRVSPIIAPSYRLFPDRTEADQIKRAYQTYGVRAVE